MSSVVSTATRIGQFPRRRVIMPDLLGNLLVVSGANLPTLVSLSRCTVPHTGRLRDLTLPIITTGGNVKMGVYSIDPVTRQRDLLSTSGSVAVGAANDWQTVYDPNLSVQAGDRLDVAFVLDGAAQIGRQVLVNAAFSGLPVGFETSGAMASRKLSGRHSPPGFALPVSIADADVTISGASVYVVTGYIT